MENKMLKQTAFTYSNKMSKKEFENYLTEGDHALVDFQSGAFHTSAKLLTTADPKVIYLVSPFSFATYWWFFYKGRCVVYVGAIAPSIRILAGLKRLGIKKSLTMHSASSSNFRGKGYVSFVYAAALRKGYTLVTSNHTPQAGKLWEALAERMKATIAYYDETEKTLYSELARLPAAKQRTALKLLIPASVVSGLSSSVQ